MALGVLFVRLATVLSLRGATAAGDSVQDSAIAPIDQRVKERRRPSLAVYSDDFAAEQLEGIDFLTGERSLQLVIEAVVADQSERPIDGGAEISITIPETDEGLELQLNLIERQILRRLQAGEGPWPEIWRTLVVKVRKFESRRGAGLEAGVRFAARQLVLTISPLPEPGFGAEPGGVWRRFLTQLAEEPDLAALAPLLEAELIGESLPDWRAVQALLGLTRPGIDGTGLAPPFEAAGDEPAPLLERITFDDGDQPRVIEPDPEA
ncbi:MAG: hypothetical protein Q8L59_11110 [Phenylobacterium sp.]|nr:hypothetical protein [Phenylobacterium sp.]